MTVRQKQRGFTLAEMLIVILIIATILTVALFAGPKGMNYLRSFQISHHIDQIQQGVINCSENTGNYSWVSMSALQTDECIPLEMGDGSNYNPFNGSYTVSVGTDPFTYVITTDNVPTENGVFLMRRYGGNTTYDKATKTFTVQMGG